MKNYRMIKTAVAALSAVVMLGAFAGCNGNSQQSDVAEENFTPGPPPEVVVDTSSPAYGFRLESDLGYVVSFAHTTEQVEEVLGDLLHSFEFEDGVEILQFIDHEEILPRVFGNKVVNLRLEEWEEHEKYVLEEWHAVVPLADGSEQTIQFGDERSTIESYYTSSQYMDILNNARVNFAFVVSYDSNFQPCDFSLDAPYQVEYRFEGNKLNVVILWDTEYMPDYWTPDADEEQVDA